MNNKLKNIFFNILTLLVTIFVCLFLIEMSIKFFWRKNTSSGYPTGLIILDKTKGHKYAPNFTGYFKTSLYKNIEIKINSKGLRDYEHDYLKKEDTIRILGIGDSVTFGTGVKFEDTYLRILENKFNNNNFKIEIIKAGINKYELIQEYNYYIEELYKYNPDFIILGIVLNDIRCSDPNAIIQDKIKNESESVNKAKESKSVNIILKLKNKILKKLKSFETYKFINESLNKKKLRKEMNRRYAMQIYELWKGYEWEIYKKIILNLNTQLLEDNKKLILIIFPYTEQFKNSFNIGKLPQVLITDLGEKNNITVIDLIDTLDKKNYLDFYLSGDNVHLNAEGYKIVADKIYNYLLENKIIIHK